MISAKQAYEQCVKKNEIGGCSKEEKDLRAAGGNPCREECERLLACTLGDH